MRRRSKIDADATTEQIDADATPEQIDADATPEEIDADATSMRRRSRSARREKTLIRPFGEKLGTGSPILWIEAAEGDRISGVSIIVVVVIIHIVAVVEVIVVVVIVVVVGITSVMGEIVVLLSGRIGVEDGHAGCSLHAPRRSVGEGGADGGTAFVIIFVAESFAFTLELLHQLGTGTPYRSAKFGKRSASL